MPTAQSAPSGSAAPATTAGMVDCDIHHTVSSMRDLFPYLPDTWRAYIEETGFSRLPNVPYPKTGGGGMRKDAHPAGGGGPGSDLGLLQEQVLDAYGVSFGILTGTFYNVSFMAIPEFGAALASAFNDWTIENWLARGILLHRAIELSFRHREWIGVGQGHRRINHRLNVKARFSRQVFGDLRLS